jgi:hypothetical protein
MSLLNQWVAIESSLNVRSSLLTDLTVAFRKDGVYYMSDTANCGDGKFTVSFNDDTSGVLSLIGGFWTERSREFQTKEEDKEATKVDNLAFKLSHGDYKFTINSNKLTIYYDEEQYVTFTMILFDVISLYRKWQAVESNLDVRQKLLEDITLKLGDKNFWITDTANTSDGTFSIKIKDRDSHKVSGKISFISTGWTQMARIFTTGNVIKKSNEAFLINKLAHKLSDDKHKFTLLKDKLILDVGDEYIIFAPI